jgi:hypothetical protein
MKKIDMSEKAILIRLNQTEQLREVSLYLMKAKRLHDEKLAKTKETREPVKTVNA